MGWRRVGDYHTFLRMQFQQHLDAMSSHPHSSLAVHGNGVGRCPFRHAKFRHFESFGVKPHCFVFTAIDKPEIAGGINCYRFSHRQHWRRAGNFRDFITVELPKHIDLRYLWFSHACLKSSFLARPDEICVLRMDSCHHRAEHHREWQDPGEPNLLAWFS